MLSNSLLFIALFAFALAYFACSTVLMASLITLKKGEAVDVRRILNGNSWIGLAYLANASSAGLVFVSFDRVGIPLLLAAVPIIALFLATINARFRRAETA